jgi:hypothetical protein
MIVQVPVPIVGVLPASVAVVTHDPVVKSEPAFEIVGIPFTITVKLPAVSVPPVHAPATSGSVHVNMQ